MGASWMLVVGYVEKKFALFDYSGMDCCCVSAFFVPHTGIFYSGGGREVHVPATMS